MTSTLRALTDANFNDAINTATKPLLVECGAQWCPPCRVIEPHLAAIAESRSDVEIVTLDADDNTDVCARYGVRSLPTLLLFDRGRVVAQIVGAMPRVKIEAWIDAHVRRGSGAHEHQRT